MRRFTEHEWDRRYAGSGLLWTAKPNRFLVAEASELPAGRALDLATGEGRNAVWLAEQRWQVVGVDFSRARLEKARQLAVDGGVEVAWLQTDLLDYRPEPRALDLVLVFYLQVPQKDRQPILSAEATAVRVAGRCSSLPTRAISSKATSARRMRASCTRRKFPICSIIRPTQTVGAASGAVKGLAASGLFTGESQEFFTAATARSQRRRTRS
jgi:SAM-dependent methyltransferase